MVGANCFNGYYNQNGNKLYLKNNENTQWLGGFVPGTNQIIENDYAKLDCSKTVVTSSGNTTSIKWAVTFKESFAGKTYNTYLFAKDDTDAKTRWEEKGTWEVKGAPQDNVPKVEAITPSSGQSLPDEEVFFTTSYSDPNGWQDLKLCRLIINTGVVGRNCFNGYYNQNENRLYLKNNDNTQWLGGFTPGENQIIENDYVKLDCSKTVVTGSGDTSTVKWAVTFKESFSGKIYNTYLFARDDANAKTGWQQKGIWEVKGAPQDNVPKVGSITPSSGQSLPDEEVFFTTIYSDPNGWRNLKICRLMINVGVIGGKCFNGYYNQNGNKLYLKNNNNTQWLGSFTPGVNQTIENDYAKLDCSKTTVTGSGDTITIKWAVTFKESFAGKTYNTYVFAKDDTNAKTKWEQKGIWEVLTGDTISPTGTIKINNDSNYTNSFDVTLNLSAQDNAGGSGISKMQFSNDGSTWTSLEPYATTKSWSLDPGDGTKTVYVKFQDVSGNLSATISDNIILDTTPPQILITSPIDGSIEETSPITFSGTIDGVAFNETISLDNQGENILTKTATDLAGNTASSFVKVYFYAGDLIGPEGGEVTSSDGKVKVIIPEGALTEPTAINIIPVEPETLIDATPGDTTLLSAVECRPYDLVFNKPVLLIYTLNQAEVPGTSVELGLYDRIQDKIVSTGETSTVAVDGYTVSFSLMHFSTFAALKSTTSEVMPISASVKIPLPDVLTGAFSHSIPITVAPGRKGLQPNLALTYRSGNPNSWVGLGYGLNPGYIVRSTRLGPPSYTDNDTFYFITDGGTTELVHLIDNLYQSKVESSFTKFFKEQDDSWRVVTKDGTVLKFGQDSNSKETQEEGTFSWYVTRVVDTNGNYIGYQYTKDEGKCYPSSIEYTGNEMGISPLNSVEFSLEARDDISSSYISGAKIATTKRLKEILVKVDGALVWRYELQYDYSEDTNRSLLRSITQYDGSDDKSFPTQSFGYQKAE